MIAIKTPEEIAIMKEGGQILARILKKLEKEVRPGITTKYLDKLALELVLKYGARPSFLNYGGGRGNTGKPFPAGLCASVNEEIVHAIPSDRILKEGDIISLDFGVFYKGFHTDAAITVAVGKVLPEVSRLIKVTKKSLKRGIKKTRPGNTISDIGNTIQRYIEGRGFTVVKELCGHGVGKNLHEEPDILNFGQRGKGPKIKEGMVFAIEPMATNGGWEIKRGKDGFSWESKDGSLSAHFEHTVAVTKNGAEVLTILE